MNKAQTPSYRPQRVIAAAAALAACSAAFAVPPASAAPPLAAPSVTTVAAGNSADPTEIAVAQPWSKEFGFAETQYPGTISCPMSTPYLVNRNYAPAMTQLVTGVEIKESGGDPWPVNIYMPMYESVPQNPQITAPYAKSYLTGLKNWDMHTSEGFPAMNSASRWAPFPDSPPKIQIILHCTGNPVFAATGYNFGTKDAVASTPVQASAERIYLAAHGPVKGDHPVR